VTGVHAPEPWRDPPPPLPPRYGPEDPLTLERDQREQITEFGWGAGLVPPHLNGRPPSEHGIYMPKAPRVDPPRNAEKVGRPRQHHRSPDEAKGYPGEQVAG